LIVNEEGGAQGSRHRPCGDERPAWSSDAKHRGNALMSDSEICQQFGFVFVTRITAHELTSRYNV